MPWAEVLPSGKYRAVWRDQAGRQRSRSPFAHKAAATRFAGEQESRARRGELTVAGRSPTWASWRDTWVEQWDTEDSTSKTDLGRVDRYLTPRWGKVRIAGIRRRDVQQWVRELSDTPSARQPRDREEDDLVPIAPATVARIYHTFAASMTAAVKADWIPASPCVRVDLPVSAPGHERFLTREEFDRIAYFLTGPYQLAAYISAGTGMRMSETLGLHWQRIDLGSRTIDVVEAHNPISGTIKGYPKGRKRRAVPIPQWLAQRLQEHLDEHGPGLSCGMRHDSRTRCRTGLAVATEGHALDRDNLRNRQWMPAVKLADVGHVRWHDLRHSYASWLVQDGVSLQTVGDLLGHASMIVTQRYAHLATTQHDRVRQVLDNHLSAADALYLPHDLNAAS